MTRRIVRICAWGLVIWSLWWCDGAIWAQSQVALVIGNAAYRNVSPLPNPSQDAELVAMALKRAGFTVVSVAHDLDSAQMRAALQQFSRQASAADVAVVYFAGHGIEIGGVNYLIPTDAALAHDSDVTFETIPLALVQDAIAGAKTLKIVILDACRNNPFAAKMEGSKRSLGRGLARVEPAASNMLVVYAAEAGTTADDGKGGNSPFAVALARRLVQPGLEVQFIFRAVHDDVQKATNHQQTPMTYGSLGGEPIYFLGGAPAASKPTLPDAAAEDRDDWNAVKDSGDVAQYRLYVQMHPSGKYVKLANLKIQALQRPSVASASAAVASTAPLPPAAAGAGSPAYSLSQVEQMVGAIRMLGSSYRSQGDIGREAAIKGQLRAQQSGPAEVSVSGCRFRGTAMNGGTLAEGYGAATCSGRSALQGLWRGGHLFMGTTMLANGCEASGHFEDERLESGEIVCAGGPYKMFVGTFANDKLEGQGLRTDRNDVVWIGTWRNGVLDGVGLKQDVNGQTLEGGLYKAGKLTVAAMP